MRGSPRAVAGIGDGDKARSGAASAGCMSLKELVDDIRAFAIERDWGKYHTPKNLSMALAIEASELMEIFQWLTPRESRKLGDIEKKEAEDEIGDVLIYLLRLADSLSISPVDAARKKLVKNRTKYPVEKSRGNAKKYTRF